MRKETMWQIETRTRMRDFKKEKKKSKLITTLIGVMFILWVWYKIK